jgi:cytochrome b involved in lipid metabolism
VLGVDSRLYDVSAFVERHPGSTDTLLDNAGKDASEVRQQLCLHVML